MSFQGSLQDIRLFVAAYEERSFTAAAARETSTQSGVSHHMRQLEDALGVKPFVRDKSGILATPAADVFYNYCIDVLRALDEATDQLARFVPGHQSAFAVGLIPALANRIGVPALLRFSEKNPNVRVKMVGSYSSGIGDLVASGVLDFAVSPMHGHETGVRGRPLTTAPECLIARAGSKKKKPFNMVWASKMPGRRAAIRAALAANDIRIDRELEIDSGLATLDLVARSDDANQSALEMFTRGNTWTLRQILDEKALCGTNVAMIGTPASIAEEMIKWLDEADLDGFNLARIVAHETTENFIAKVIPELQSRGRYKTAYAPGTFREKLFGHRRIDPRHPAGKVSR